MEQPLISVVPRVVLGLLTLASSALGVSVFARAAGIDGWDLLDPLLLLLFAVLFTWLSFSFWVAALGFVATAMEPVKPASHLQRANWSTSEPLPRTVLLMPIYNEDPTEVFAGLHATCESLKAAGVAHAFDVFILSDTRKPDIWLQEEQGWAWLASKLAGTGMNVHYRRRTLNVAKKAGNIAEFCRRWGAHYKYMVIFDADSVMSGSTIAEMVRRMEARPDVGMLQAPPLPVGRESLFARMQQFAASAYGDIYAAGLSTWSQYDANYYGHNAIIRVQPFIENCALPKLPGKPPLGGEILSHDFVEAAMMRRAGWKVVLADDLSGSYEQCPPTLFDFAKRDHRWCLGNLQHARIFLRSGLHPSSRLHLFSGIMGYLAAPIWLLFMLLGVLQDILHRTGSLGATDANPLFSRWPMVLLLLATFVLLLLPKALALLLLEKEPIRLVGHGDYFEAAASAAIETVISMLVAPVLMVYHTMFVLATLTGHQVQWNAQRREETGTTFLEAARELWIHTLGGVSACVLLWFASPPLFWWLLPVNFGLVVSIPVAMALSSVSLGRALRSHHLFLIPDEQFEAPILKLRADAANRRRARRDRSPHADPLAQVILIPEHQEMHLALLRSSREQSGESSAAPQAAARPLPQSLEELDKLSDAQKVALLSDEAALRELHQHAWLRWPADEIIRRSA